MNLIAIITSSIVAPLLVGIILNYIKNIKPTIIFQSINSIPLLSESRNMNKGIYLIEMQNISSKTIKEVSLFIRLEGADVKIGGIRCAQGLQYTSDVENNGIEIKIPFFRENDELAISVIAESHILLPEKPEIAIRSAQHFKSRTAHEHYERKKFLNSLLLIIGATMGILSFSLFQSGRLKIVGPEKQKEVIMFAANVNGLHNLPDEIMNLDLMKYFDQGDIVYARAKLAKTPEDVKKYSNFLKTILEYDENMLKISKCVISYNIAKLALILNNKSEAKEYLQKAIILDKNLVEKRLKFDVEARDIK